LNVDIYGKSKLKYKKLFEKYVDEFEVEQYKLIKGLTERLKLSEKFVKNHNF